jgi:hypothetical protein
MNGPSQSPQREEPFRMTASLLSNVRAMTIEGKRFELTLCPQPNANTWHWIIAAPGELVLSGEATSETQALDSACSAGRALARMVVA